MSNPNCAAMYEYLKKKKLAVILCYLVRNISRLLDAGFTCTQRGSTVLSRVLEMGEKMVVAIDILYS